MLTQERQEQILQLLKKQRSATVAQLTQALGASEATIRRDLTQLDRKGLLHKVHGGATLGETLLLQDEAVTTRSGRHAEEKERIARYAASLVVENDFIFLDAGTTTEKLIDYLPHVRATFVTNGVSHARRLISKGFTTYLLGGILKPVTEALVGALTVEGLSRYHFTKSFMGTNGISLEGGFTTPDTEEATVKTAAADRTYMVYILADSSKFGQISAVTFAPLEKACIITDRISDDRYQAVTIVKQVPDR